MAPSEGGRVPTFRDHALNLFQVAFLHDPLMRLAHAFDPVLQLAAAFRELPDDYA